MYSPNCGLDKTLVSWGHDEYCYQVLKHNKTTLPDEALYIVRYVHNLYLFLVFEWRQLIKDLNTLSVSFVVLDPVPETKIDPQNS